MPLIAETTTDSPESMTKRGYELVGTFDDEQHFPSQDWIFDTEPGQRLVATSGTSLSSSFARAWIACRRPNPAHPAR